MKSCLQLQLTRVLFLTFLLFIITQKLNAQDFKYEVGGMAGTAFYMGDANKSELYKNASLAAGLVFRYNKDFRWSVKGNLAMGHISGSTINSGDAFPNNLAISFSRNIYELSGQLEFNFFNYSDKYAYLETKKWSPYAFIGLGCTLGSGDKRFFGLNIPMGLGLKYKLRERLNLGFEFSFRKLLRDDLDVTSRRKPNLDDPLGTNSSVLKNNDWYSFTLISLTWDFGVRCKPCMKN